jgi:hypothetical protein
MFQGFETGEEKFRGQRLLTTAVLLLFAVGMVAMAIKEIAAGRLFESDLPIASTAIAPVLTLPGRSFETRLAEVTLDQAGQLTRTGWLKTSPQPGEPGVSIIGISPDWPVANLKPGDRLGIGIKNENLAFEVIAGPVAENVAISAAGSAGTATSLRELKLVVVDPAHQGAAETITARLVSVN